MAAQDIANVFRKIPAHHLRMFTFEYGLAKHEEEMHLPANLLAYHTSESLDLKCSKKPKINSTTVRKQLTIDRDAFSSTRNVTESLYIWDCDLSLLNFAFLDGFDQLELLKIHHSSNVGMADWGSLPPLPSLQQFFIDDNGMHPNNSWADNVLPSFEHGIKKLSLVGNAFLGDKTAERILKWIHKSSAQTNDSHRIK